MDDLLKEAIADAKAVRETALANAKMALEEAFTPRLKSMLASKIANEVEGEDHDEVEDAEEVYDEEEMEEPEMEVPAEEGEMEDAEEGGYDEVDVAPEEDEEAPVEPEADEAPEEGVIEIDGVKYAPVVSEEEDEEGEEVEEVEDAEDADELDLESILRELEEEEDKEDEELDENDVSSGIGKSDNAHNAESGDSSKVGQGPEGEGSDKEAGKELDDHEVVKEGEDKEDEMDEDIDLDEVLKALSEEESEEEEVDEVNDLKQEIKEHRDVVKFLRAKLNEVNLLNAKLLFSNKLFRTFGLTNEQKMKVVETFDRTKNLREIKLVYSTLAESFGQVKKPTIKESIKKSSSSKAIASTKPKKEVISEGDDLKARFKKLANII